MLWFLRFVAPFLICAAVRAEGLVQLTLWGALPAEEAARVEVVLDLQTSQSPIVLEMAVLLGPGTSATSLAQWIQAELESAGARSILTLAPHDPSAAPRADLYLPRATSVKLRLGHGLEGRVTVCEGPPLRVRIRPGVVNPAGTTLEVQASAWQPHDDKRFSARLEFEVKPGAHPAQIAADLFQAAHQAGWSSERPEDDLWQPVRMNDGARITGCSLSLSGPADAMLELDL